MMMTTTTTTMMMMRSYETTSVTRVAYIFHILASEDIDDFTDIKFV